MRKTLLLLVPTLALGACTWGITLSDAGKSVRTAWHGDVSQCRDLGKVTVSVQDHVGPVNRNDIKVRDELEVLARNEAASMHADTIKPLAEPADGSQPWGAYACGARPVGDERRDDRHDSSPPPPPRDGNGAQTFPVKGG